MTRSRSFTSADILSVAGRLLLITLGLWVFALGIVLTLRSNLGLGPWDVLNQGLSRHLPISLGQASIMVSLGIVLLSFLLGIKPGVGTIMNGVLIGYFIDQINYSPLVPQLASDDLLPRLVVDAVGVFIVGIGTALYIKARLGAGPRDSLMLALRDRLHIRVGLARAGVEIAALICGWLLGGTVGLGTLVFAFGIGPAVEISFRLFRVKGKAW